MSLLGTLFGSSKALEKTAEFGSKIVDNAGSFIDKAFHTDQEKAEAKSKFLADNMNMTVLMNKFNDQGKSLSRRVIAFAFVLSYLLPLWVGTIFSCFDRIQTADIFLNMSDKLSGHVQFIFYFYFGYYGVTSIIGKFKKEK